MLKAHIIIPCRLASTRLPNKPLADIAGKAMICHVVDRARETGITDITVACDSEEIAQVVKAHGAHAVLTDPELPSGSDRIWQAMTKLIAAGAPKPDVVINIQGDEPLIAPELITQGLKAFEKGDADVVTFAHPITQQAEIDDPSMVKVVTNSRGIAHYFSRCSIPHGGTEFKRHIGFYAYTYEALERFVSAQPSKLELLEKLEQLRGLELGLRYKVEMTSTAPIGVDTPEDLEKVRALMA